MKTNNFTKKIQLFSLLMIISASPLFSESWTKTEGTNKFINSIFQSRTNPSEFVVGSDILKTDYSMDKLEFAPAGSGLQKSIDNGMNFGNPILAEEYFSVYDIYQSKLNPNRWYAAVRKLGTGGILVSDDNGATWDTENIRCTGSYQIMKITSTIIDDKEIFFNAATNISTGFIISEDDFTTCLQNQELKVSSLDIRFSEADPNLLFMAGDHQSDYKVMRSYDKGQTWLGEESGLNGLRILTVCPSAIDPAIVYAGADSLNLNKQSRGKGIYQSLDTGKTWTRIALEGYQVYKIVTHPSYPRTMAAACGNAGVYISGNNGFRWDSANHNLYAHVQNEDITNLFVKDVFIPDWEITVSGFKVFAALDSVGLFVSDYLVKVEESNILEDISIYPQPASTNLNLNLKLKNSSNIEIQLFDLLGNHISTIYNDFVEQGENHINLVLPKLSNGMYLLKSRIGFSMEYHKIVITN